jgi:uncharacterized protein YecT (DUF1311 family)
MGVKIVTVRALGCALAALGRATPASADDAYSHCLDNSSTNLEWGECGEALLERLDAALNTAWKGAKASVDQQTQKDLLVEQRAWLKFRDSSCRFWANGSFGRDGQVLHFIQCRAEITKTRISDLNEISEFLSEHD